MCDGIGHLAAHFSGDRLDEALAAVLALADDTHRGEALGTIAPHLDATRLGRAIDAAAGIPDPQLRVATLTAMLPHVPPESQPAAARTALLATPAITPDEDRADALLRLAEALPAARTVARPGA